MSQRVLIPLYGNDVAPRFDLATEAYIARLDENGIVEEHTYVLPHASSDELCRMVLSESVSDVICGAIEEEYFQYLTWKKVTVIDSVIGPYAKALERLRTGRLEPGDILADRHGG